MILAESEIGKTKRRYLFNNSSGISNNIYFKFEILVEFFIAFKVNSELLLINAVVYFIVNWDDKAIFLFDEAFVHLVQVLVAGRRNISAIGIRQPLHHRSLMMK